MMATKEGEQEGVGTLVQQLLVAMQDQARAKPHPLLYVNLAFLLAIAFWSGVTWSQVQDLQTRVRSLPQSTEMLSSELGYLKGEVTRMRDRLETLVYEQQRSTRK